MKTKQIVDSLSVENWFSTLRTHQFFLTIRKTTIKISKGDENLNYETKLKEINTEKKQLEPEWNYLHELGWEQKSTD